MLPLPFARFIDKHLLEKRLLIRRKIRISCEIINLGVDFFENSHIITHTELSCA